MATSIYSGPFWKSTAERAAKTAIQTLIPLAGGAQFSILGLDWAVVGYGVASAVVLSILTSLLSGLNGTGPSAIGSEIKADAVVLDEVELAADEVQQALDRMIIDGSVDEQTAPALAEGEHLEGIEPEEELEVTDETVQPGPEPVAEEDVIEEEVEVSEDLDESSLEQESLAEVDDTPPPEGYQPRH